VFAFGAALAFLAALASLLRGTSPTAKPLAPRTAATGDTLAAATDDSTETTHREKGYLRPDPGN
jgi:hypothetical protein